MSNPVSPSFHLASPLEWTGRLILAMFAYLGGLAELVGASVVASFRRSESPSADSFFGELSWMLRLGMPLVAVVHVGIGSFLSMQSYFGGTFVEGTGAVVGVGLIRNVAPLMACLTLTGLLAARITPELRTWRRDREAPRDERTGFFERTASEQPQTTPRPAGTAATMAAPRLLAATIAGLVLSVWAIVVGTAVGWQVAQTMLGVSTDSFFQMFWDMLWVRDVVGLIIKGLLFGLLAAMFSCHEGLRGSPDDGLDQVSTAACRAACLAAVAILIINSGWFILAYHAGPAFGPTLMAPPTS